MTTKVIDIVITIGKAAPAPAASLRKVFDPSGWPTKLKRRELNFDEIN
jgi:hypothetical protein